MSKKAEEQAYLISLDLYIEELEERISSLQERIPAVVEERYEAKAQEVLLSNMEQLWEDMKAFRIKALETFNATYSES